MKNIHKHIQFYNPFTSDFDVASENVYTLCKDKITEAAEEIKRKQKLNPEDEEKEKSMLDKFLISVDKHGADPEIPMLMAMG